MLNSNSIALWPGDPLFLLTESLLSKVFGHLCYVREKTRSPVGLEHLFNGTGSKTCWINALESGKILKSWLQENVLDQRFRTGPYLLKEFAWWLVISQFSNSRIFIALDTALKIDYILHWILYFFHLVSKLCVTWDKSRCLSCFDLKNLCFLILTVLWKTKPGSCNILVFSSEMTTRWLRESPPWDWVVIYSVVSLLLKQRCKLRDCSICSVVFNRHSVLIYHRYEVEIQFVSYIYGLWQWKIGEQSSTDEL